MAKTISAILSGPIGLIDKRLGAQISGIALTAIGLATGNTFLVALGTFQLQQGFGALPQKPPTTEATVRSPLAPRVDAFGTSRLYPSIVCYETASDGSTVDVGAFCEGPIGQVVRTYLNDEEVTVIGGLIQALPDKTYQGGNVRMGWNLGASIETAFAPVVSAIPDRWTNQHRGDGVVSAYLIKRPEKEKYYLQTYPQGDNVQMSLVGNWKRVFDWRDASQSPSNPATWQWSDNPVLCFVWWLMVRRGYDWNTKLLPQIARLTAAANDCDVAMPLAAGGTEPRYRTSLSFPLTEKPANITSAFLSCFDGWFDTNEAGEVIIYSGRYYEPTVSLSPNDIIAYNVPYGVSVEDAVTEITVQYVDALHDFKAVDGDAWRDDDAITAAGGLPNTVDLGASIPSFTQGRRLAKRKMARLRQAPITVSTTIGGDRVIGQRYINIDLSEAGVTFYRGPVEIITPPERNTETGGVTFQCVRVDPNIDAWNPATEDGNGAPEENRVAPEPLERPVIASALAVYTEATDAGTGARIQIEATAPERDGLTWYARWRRPDSSVWVEQEFPDEDPGAGVTLLTGFVPIAQTIQVQVEYRASDGRLSGWSDTQIVDTRTDVTPPDTATTIAVSSWADTLSLVTDRIPRASTYRWRFYAADGTTLIRAITTTTPQVAYSSAQAATDGARRSYVVRVAGINGAGAGDEASTAVLTLPAPPTVVNVSASGGASEATVTFDLSAAPGVIGYLLPVSTVQNFDPLTQGTIFRSFGSPAYLQGLATGSFYTKVAAYDAWTDRPDLLNFSDEKSFAITAGGGGVGGGGGGGGGGYCPDVETLILLANDGRDGPGVEVRAGDLAAGDWVWTQHERTLAWGAYEVEAVSIERHRVWGADIGIKHMRATRGHRVWLGGSWVRFDAIGRPDGRTNVAKITVREAHTYISNSVLSHNIKQSENEV